MYLVLELELPADARLLGTTRRTLGSYLAEVGADAEERADVVLALDEACGNVIRHAFPPGVEGSLRVRVEMDDASVVVEVEDDGHGFDPTDVELRAPRPDDVSGRGLHIIRSLMTSVQLQSPTESGGTRLCMQRMLRGGPPTRPTRIAASGHTHAK